MDDLEITRRCAEAMGEEHRTAYDWDGEPYNPLHDDAQAMALARRYPLVFEKAVIEWANHVRRGDPFDINKYFCQRIAEGERQ